MRTRRPGGFTMIEILMVLVLLAVGMAMSMGLFISAMKDARVKQCRANMQAIANCEEEYKYKSAGHTYTTVLANLTGNFPVVPKCPNGGTYSATISTGASTSQSGQTVPAGGLVISCSVGTDGKFAQTIDAQ
jgi:prepilin-type N-terminal cleavage/methylation domain-containing protein